MELSVATEADQLENGLHRSQIGIRRPHLNGRMYRSARGCLGLVWTRYQMSSCRFGDA
jgi:hypothetical protein